VKSQNSDGLQKTKEGGQPQNPTIYQHYALGYLFSQYLFSVLHPAHRVKYMRELHLP
jgi:hypothetical protein